MSKMSGDFIEIPGRKEAIKAGIEMMQAGDILLIAGRGHENFQYVKGDLIEFNDKTVAKNYLK
jgi:UDP-N-acetylmuramoyl-L-alanyl-D-glutamate--2,6-diaminopimelate ligase